MFGQNFKGFGQILRIFGQNPNDFSYISKVLVKITIYWVKIPNILLKISKGTSEHIKGFGQNL